MSDYLQHQIITYLGNKRALLPPIDAATRYVKSRLNKESLDIYDAFAGSGIVSRLFKSHASVLYVNDLEAYAATLGRCYLTNSDGVDYAELNSIVADLNAQVDTVDLPPGFIRELYAPVDENAITLTDRVVYTVQNATRLDNYRRLIDTVPAKYHDLLLGPLLWQASVHVNNSGHFKSFYKDRNTKLGRYGGTGGDALKRILGPVVLEVPVLSRYQAECHVYQQDATVTAMSLKDLDLVYLDPPYNQHPYGSNYFMLNLLVAYVRPDTARISASAGIPENWQRSAYNRKDSAFATFTDLIRNCPAKYLLISLNNESYINRNQLRGFLKQVGKVKVYRQKYNTYRGSLVLRADRARYVEELFFLVERC